MKKLFLICLALGMGACTGKHSSPGGPATLPTRIEARALDLASLLPQAGKGRSQIVQVKTAPVFHGPATYRALDFGSLLRAYWPQVQESAAQHRLHFFTNDHYQVSMPWDDAVAGGGYLAWMDLAAPQGRDWRPLSRQGQSKKLAPFYLAWEDGPDSQRSLVWLYGLERIHLAKKTGD